MWKYFRKYQVMIKKYHINSARLPFLSCHTVSLYYVCQKKDIVIVRRYPYKTMTMILPDKEEYLLTPGAVQKSRKHWGSFIEVTRMYQIL